MPKVVKLGDGVEMTDNTKEILEALDDAISRGLNAIGMQCEGYAKGLCPVDTGRLRNSITHTFSGAGAMTQTFSDTGKHRVMKDGKQKFVKSSSGKQSFGSTIGSLENDHTKSVYVGTNVEYAVYVELDDKKKHPNGQAHFLRDAATKHLSEYGRIFESYMKGQE